MHKAEHRRYGLGVAGDWEEFCRFGKRLLHIERRLIGHKILDNA